MASFGASVAAAVAAIIVVLLTSLYTAIHPDPLVNGFVRIMMTCTKNGTGYDLENTRDGKTVSKVKVETSPDGKKLTQTVNVMPPEGDPYTITVLSKKVSGGNGAPVVWKETSFTESQDTGILTIKVNGDSVDFKETDNDKPITLKLDGTPEKFGRGTISIKQDGPRTLEGDLCRQRRKNGSGKHLRPEPQRQDSQGDRRHPGTLGLDHVRDVPQIVVSFNARRSSHVLYRTCDHQPTFYDPFVHVRAIKRPVCPESTCNAFETFRARASGDLS